MLPTDQNQQEKQEEQVAFIMPKRTNSLLRKRGTLKRANDSVGKAFGTIENGIESIDIIMEIATVSLRQSLAETISEGVQDLMKVGYTQEDALAILQPNQ